jgi:hypothetical protein
VSTLRRFAASPGRSGQPRPFTGAQLTVTPLICQRGRQCRPALQIPAILRNNVETVKWFEYYPPGAALTVAEKPSSSEKDLMASPPAG